MRLESRERTAAAPFLASLAPNEGVIYLPKTNQVVRGASPQAVVAAVFGVPFSGQDLFGLLTGCPFGGGGSVAPRDVGPGWQRVAVGEDDFLLRQGRNGTWRISAYTHPTAPSGERWRAVFERRSQDRLPFRIRLSSLEWSGAEGLRFDLTWTLSQLQVEPLLPVTAFSIDVPRAVSLAALQTVTADGPLVARSPARGSVRGR